MKSIIIIIDYFADSFPEWFPCFLKSCEYNPTISWLIHSDCLYEYEIPENVNIEYLSGKEYIDYVSQKLDISFQPKTFQKICDIKPMFGYLWEDSIEGYDFWGFGDLDVIYGDLRHHLDEQVLEHNIISTHNWCLSGHMCLFINKKWTRNVFRKIKNWKEIAQDQEPKRFDEDTFSRYFFRGANQKKPAPKKSNHNWHPPMKYFGYFPRKGKRSIQPHNGIFGPYKRPAFVPGYPFGKNKIRYFLSLLNPFSYKYYNSHFKEYFTTPLVPFDWIGGEHNHPEVWFWYKGKVFNQNDKGRQFIYLHFMNYVNATSLDMKYGFNAPWSTLGQINRIDDIKKTDGFQIDFNGISPFTMNH